MTNQSLISSKLTLGNLWAYLQEVGKEVMMAVLVFPESVTLKSLYFVCMR